VAFPWLGLLVGTILLVSCVADDEPEAGTPSTGAEAATTSAPSERTTTTAADDQPIPVGPYYLPSDLPDGWELAALRVFSFPDSSPVGADDPTGADSISLVVHPSTGGFGGGGAILTVTRFAGQVPFLPEGLGFGEREPLEIPGLTSVELQYDGEQASFGSIVAQVDEQTTMSLIGGLPPDQLTDIAGAFRVGDGETLAVELDLDGWVAEPRGLVGEDYILNLQGPAGSLEVTVSPGVTEATLYLGGEDLEMPLDGEVGTGYYAVQRVEAESLEFPRVHWWVPDVQLTSSAGPDLDVVAGILDGFVEVDEATFRSAIAEVAIEIIDIESGPDPDSAPPASESLDPEVLARLVEVVEEAVGREFDRPPSVSITDGEELRAMVPDGSFVSDSLWEVLLGLGLVDTYDSQADADAARRDQLRGVCCPVTVIDTGDALFNEVVIVHELTHGLDTRLGSGGSAPVELLNPTMALIEGNAHRVAFDYADVLNQDGANIPPPPNLFPPEGDPRVPTAVQRILEFPYREGRTFAVALAEQGGEAAIVKAFEQPPASTEQIMNPDAYLQGDAPVIVSAPTLPDDATVSQQGTIGAFLLSLVAEPVVGAEEAVELALAWRGDAYHVYELDGQRCLAATIEFDSADDAEVAAEALAAGDVEVTTERDTVRATRCR